VHLVGCIISKLVTAGSLGFNDYSDLNTSYTMFYLLSHVERMYLVQWMLRSYWERAV